ncbi:hypothetical protein Acr_01g0010040 [Actinidia rufa]|uniref:Uncharacterized protein n=1 Tax=Actinidia rufa TaxID=165716 RepID=A0A7J0E493_9ERIC|nr:hypothetical protein Acr_01g0010040 [Actinidia rufa]
MVTMAVQGELSQGFGPFGLFLGLLAGITDVDWYGMHVALKVAWQIPVGFSFMCKPTVSLSKRGYPVWASQVHALGSEIGQWAGTIAFGKCGLFIANSFWVCGWLVCGLLLIWLLQPIHVWALGSWTGFSGPISRLFPLLHRGAVLQFSDHDGPKVLRSGRWFGGALLNFFSAVVYGTNGARFRVYNWLAQNQVICGSVGSCPIPNSGLVYLVVVVYLLLRPLRLWLLPMVKLVGVCLRDRRLLPWLFEVFVGVVSFDNGVWPRFLL